MAATKTQRILLSSQSLAAGASVNAAEWNLTTAYAGSVVCVKITNGASAPTTVPIVKFYSGGASGVKRTRWQGSGDTVNNSQTDLFYEYAQGEMYGNVTITNGSTNAITVEVEGQEATGI